MRLIVLVAMLGCSSSSPGHSIDAGVDALSTCPTSDAGTGCASGDFCEIFIGGVAPAGCTAIPSACTATPTCACMIANPICGATVTCHVEGDQLVVTCEGI